VFVCVCVALLGHNFSLTAFDVFPPVHTHTHTHTQTNIHTKSHTHTHTHTHTPHTTRHKTRPTGAPFPLPYFSLWVWIGIVWGFLSSVIITLLPLYESRAAIGKVRACIRLYMFI
jgi:hypothetical protein